MKADNLTFVKKKITGIEENISLRRTVN